MQKIAIVLTVLSGVISGFFCAYSISIRESHNSIFALVFIATLTFLPFLIPVLCIRKNVYVNLLVVLLSFALSYKGSEIYYEEIVLNTEPSYAFMVLIVPLIFQAPLFFLMAVFVAVFYYVKNLLKSKFSSQE